MLGCGAGQIRRQHQKRLTDPIPGIQTAASPVESKLRIFVGKDLRLPGPEGMCDLQPVHGVRRTKLPGLDEEGEEAGNQKQKEEGAREGPLRHQSDSKGFRRP